MAERKTAQGGADGRVRADAEATLDLLARRTEQLDEKVRENA